MTKNIRRSGEVRVPFSPVVTEGPVPGDRANVRILLKELHRLETRLRERKGEITSVRQLLLSNSAEEHWEVPG